MSYINACMWNLEKVAEMILFAKQKYRHRSREKNVWKPRGRKRRWDKLGAWD